MEVKEKQQQGSIALNNWKSFRRRHVLIGKMSATAEIFAIHNKAEAKAKPEIEERFHDIDGWFLLFIWAAAVVAAEWLY